MKTQCPQCKALLESEEILAGDKVQCPDCLTKFEAMPYIRKASEETSAAQDAGAAAAKAATKVGDSFTKAVGIEKLEGFSFSALFADVFKKHDDLEVERAFTCGTPETTPPLDAVDSSWPRPWIFMRALIASVVVYWALHSGWRETENTNLLPGMMLIGSFAVPISTLMFFIEANVLRNISLFQVFRVVLLGGVAGIVYSAFVWNLFGSDSEYIMAILAGLIEETMKLAALVRCRSLLKRKYILNGLLVGAALGVGFAAFESAGYAFNTLLREGEVSSMEVIILMRGVLSPLGHIIWTAIVCAALWRVKGDRPFTFSMLVDKRFLRLAAVPVALHIAWDLPSAVTPGFLGFVLRIAVLGLVGWIVVLSLIQEGLKEIRKEKEAVAAEKAA